jgi:hypothetical protein
MVQIKKAWVDGRIMSRGIAALCIACVLFVAGCECEVKIKTNSLPDGRVAQFYDFRLQESQDNCSGEGEWRIIGGNLPPGIGLTDGGRLSGIPTAAGAFQFTVEVTAGEEDTDSGTDSASKGFMLTILAQEETL